MIVKVSSDAEADIAEAYWFYERQAPGLGDYFRDCVTTERWRSDSPSQSITNVRETRLPLLPF